MSQDLINPYVLHAQLLSSQIVQHMFMCEVSVNQEDYMVSYRALASLDIDTVFHVFPLFSKEIYLLYSISLTFPHRWLCCS